MIQLWAKCCVALAAACGNGGAIGRARVNSTTVLSDGTFVPCRSKQLISNSDTS